jgi:hypothetical protein
MVDNGKNGASDKVLSSSPSEETQRGIRNSTIGKSRNLQSISMANSGTFSLMFTLFLGD